MGKAEIELAGNEVDDGNEVVDIAISAGAGLGGLNETVDPFHDSGGQVVRENPKDARDVLADRLGRLHHRLQA